ncbi:hypothetical protein GXM_04004 [Nostoc sphaeroides CCNUC1]|uniref:Uncharacterized protein n=1 Tax=Nostoc sphaeroides CCNUC1 TaxID=2653204 RepID=A0A5P8W1F2_9NOSO|nr:hypothetical protein GXM_04004 [Nostoc sphaeroides CCNUC1]
MQCNSAYIVGFTSEDNKSSPGKPRRTLKSDYLITQKLLNQIE